MDGDFWITIPGPAWGAVGVLGAAIVGVIGAFVGSWMSNRRASKLDAGTLALEYAKGLREDLEEVKGRVTVLEDERDAYRSHAHVLHEWGYTAQTPENPRPIWPATLPR